MAKNSTEPPMARGTEGGTTANILGSAKESPFANEKLMQARFGLRNRPERFVHEEFARSFASRANKFNRIVRVTDNAYGLKNGWYVMTPADAERLLKKTGGRLTY